MQTNLVTPVDAYARPGTLAEALRLLAQGGWQVLAGGTDLYPAAGARLTGPVLDLSSVAGLAGITQTDGLRIGAATTWASLIEADLPPACRALLQSAAQIGGRQVQVAGTIGGNLCNASPAADGVPPLLALGAEVELVSTSGTRRMALADFLTGPRRTALAPGEMLVAVIIPPAGLSGRSAFEKLGARSHLVISIASVAARVWLEGDRIAGAAIAVGACGPVPVRLAKVEGALQGAPVATALDRINVPDVQSALSPIDDIRASATYRRQAAVELIRRAVQGALA